MKTKLINAPLYPTEPFVDLKGRYIRRGKYIILCQYGFGLLSSPQKIFGKAWKIVGEKLVPVEGFNWTRRKPIEQIVLGGNYE